MHADGRTIYLSDTRRQRIIVFDVERGTRRHIDVSALGHPDGMALDENGAVWVALVAGGIARLTPDGEVDGRLEPPSAFTTSLCFAGRDLYVTTGGHSEHPELRGCVLRTNVDVAGAPVAARTGLIPTVGRTYRGSRHIAHTTGPRGTWISSVTSNPCRA